MNYLSESEYEEYGIETTTLAASVAAVSALIDTHCRRPTLGIAEYCERLRLTPGSNTVRLSYLPVVAVAPAMSPIVGVRARFGLPRKGERCCTDDLAEAVAVAFGLPGTWSDISPSALDVTPETGELTMCTNALGIPFNEIEVRYTAGFSEIPNPVKFACAQLVRNAQATPALNVRAQTMDRIQLEYFSSTLLDETVRTLLKPFVAQKVG